MNGSPPWKVYICCRDCWLTVLSVVIAFLHDNVWPDTITYLINLLLSRIVPLLWWIPYLKKSKQVGLRSGAKFPPLVGPTVVTTCA